MSFCLRFFGFDFCCGVVYGILFLFLFHYIFITFSLVCIFVSKALFQIEASSIIFSYFGGEVV